MVDIDIVTIFEVREINDKMEELVVKKVVAGTYNHKNNTFTSNYGTIYNHIETVTENEQGFGNRFTYHEFDSLLILTEREYARAKSYVYVRFKEIKNRIFRSRGADFQLYKDIDGTFFSEYLNDEELENDGKKYFQEKLSLLTPAKLETMVKETIKGQDDAIRKIVTSIWITYKFERLTKRNMFVVGPSGVGKTAIFRKIQEILNVPVIIFSVPGLSQAGYHGRSTDEILIQIYFSCNKDESLFDKAIVVLDEIDKLAYTDGMSGDISTIAVQHELLKIVEGTKRVVSIDDDNESFEIDTSHIQFIGVGAFEDIFEDNDKVIGFDNKLNISNQSREITADDIKKYGLEKELVRRFPIIVQLNPMTRETLKDIILNSLESELKLTVNAIKSMGVAIANLDEVIDLIIDDVMEKNIGASGLVSTINNIFLNIFYTIGSNNYMNHEIIIGKNIIHDNQDFEMVPIKTKTKRKT